MTECTDLPRILATWHAVHSTSLGTTPGCSIARSCPVPANSEAPKMHAATFMATRHSSHRYLSVTTENQLLHLLDVRHRYGIYCGRAGSGGGAGVLSSAAPLIEGSSVMPLLFSRLVFTSTF